MKSVCIIVHRLDVGGAQQAAVGEVEEFLRRGFRVRLVTLSPERAQSLMFSVPETCEKVLIEFRSLFDLSAYRALARLLSGMRPDIIITQMWFANTVGRIAARRACLRNRVLAFEQNVYDRLKLKTGKQFLVDRILQGWCRNVLAASRAIKESLVRSGIKPDRIVVVYDAVNLARIAEAAASGIRDDLNIADQFIYLFVGRLIPQKGVDVLIKAFAQQESGVLLVVGEGVERARLEALAGECGVESRVFFLGVRHDVPSLMKSSDCFVLASRLEGLGIVLIEAISSGMPVVATKVDGIVEVVEEGKTGLLVPPDDITALGSAMQHVREENTVRESMRTYGTQRMQQLFSIEKHVDDILACFDNFATMSR